MQRIERTTGTQSGRGKGVRRMAAVVVAASCVAPVIFRPVPALAAITGSVAGEVVTRSGRPIAGATVTLPDFGLATTSRGDGSFRFAQAVRAAVPYRRIGAVVTAPRWGRWTITGAPLYPADTLLLHAELGSRPFFHAVLTPEEVRAQPGPSAPLSTYTSTCTGWPSQKIPPRTISVYATKTGVSTRYDYVFYLTHVLPKEWIASWDADALGAGAIAAKDYSWYRTEAGHAYSGGPSCADITDYTADQVFDPTVSYASTDQAVYVTLGTLAWKDGLVFLAQYWLGSPGDPCAPTDPYPTRMDQWGTQTCATQGKLWPSIVTTFYTTAKLHYTGDLILNPGAEDPDLTTWTSSQADAFTRVSSGAYQGGWYFSVTKATTLDEVMPINGTPTTTYHLTVPLRCPTSSSTTCTVVLKVIANASDGSHLTRALKVVEPRDGSWRLYTFDPQASGIAHVSVQFNLVAQTPVQFDMVTLTTPFGGP